MPQEYHGCRLWRRGLVLALIVSLAGGSSAFAFDEVILRSTGESVKGTVTSVSPTEIVLDQAGTPVTVPVADIAEIRWDGEPPELNITRVRESNGDYQEALESYRAISGEIDPSQEYLRVDVQFLIARTLARQALTDPAKAEAAVKALSQFVADHDDSIRYYPALKWLGKVHVAADNFAKAQSVYQKLAQAPIPELKMLGQNAVGRAKLASGDLAGAMTAFEKVLAVGGDTPAALRQRFAAKLGKALVLQAKDKHDQALKTLNQVIAKAAPEAAAVHADAFVTKGVSLQSLGKPQEALLAFLHVDILFPGQPEAHAKALYHLTKLWNEVGKAQRSAEARRKLTQKYPESEWAKKL